MNMGALDIAMLFGNGATASLLAVAGVAAMSMAYTRYDSVLPSKMALAFGAGLLGLAVDEAFDLHERAGAWFYTRGADAPGPVNHVDDLIVLSYLSVGMIAVAMALPALMRVPRLKAAILATGALFAVAAAIDALGTPGTWIEAPEEALEACGAALLAIAFIRERGAARHPFDRAATNPTGFLAGGR
jgi:hypothetical protein